MTNRFLACCAVGALLLFAPCLARPALADGLTLKYQLAIKSAPEAGNQAGGQAAGQKPAQSQQDYTATLFPQSVEIHDGAILRIYDFSAKRVTIADESKKTVSSVPLYITPLANRQKRNALLRRKKAGDASLSDVDIDMALGADSDVSTANQIQTALANGKTVFTAGGRPLADFSLSDTAVPAELQASYAHFLVYEATLHPVIRRQLAAAGKVFGSLSYTMHDAGVQTDITLTLKGAEKSAAAAPSQPAGLTASYTGDAKLDAAIEKSMAPGPTLASQEEKISGFLDKKDSLRAVLAAAELSLTFGPDALKSSGPGQKALAAGNSDPVAGPTLAAINTPPRSSEAFKQAMIQITTAEKAAPDDGYLLELYRANVMRGVLETSGRKASPEEGQALQQAHQKLIDAIQMDPWLAGAYCDLATANYNTGQVQLAAVLWEQASRLAPSYPSLQSAHAVQEQVTKDFPEYF